MTSFVLRFAFALAVALASLTLGQAQAAQPQPGQWKVTTKMTFTGGPPGMGPEERTQLQCITPEQAKDPRSAFAEATNSGGQNCTTKRDWNGSVLSFETTCRSETQSTKGSMTFDTPTHYRGVMNTSAPAGGGASMQLTVTMEGQRVGECPR
jgi:hypothetical protein